MVKKGGKLPEGHINDWFWENKDMKGYIASRLPAGLPSLPFISDVPIVMEPVYRAMYARNVGEKHTRQSVFGYTTLQAQGASLKGMSFHTESVTFQTD